MRGAGCTLCPHACGARRGREAGEGLCGMGTEPVVARAAPHLWEEPCLSGTRGSGTVFFAGCCLRCVYCQNAEISRGQAGRRVTVARLAEIFTELEAAGVHNLNLVSPTPFVPAIRQALLLAKPGIPVVYNTGGYERVETLRTLSGLVDIYLPDWKYQSPEAARLYSGAPDYPGVVLPAIREMCRQTGPPVYDAQGLLRRGTLVRHLILPGQSSQAAAILAHIAQDLPPGTPVSLMSQYTPVPATQGHPHLGRRLTPRERRRAEQALYALGLAGYVQGAGAAREGYVPPFDETGV